MTSKIKKLIYILLVLIMCAGVLCACNDDDYRNPRNGEPIGGEFYTIDKAYENGWLSKGDLRNIAYYLNRESQDKDFKPAPKNPENLSEILKLIIREDGAIYYRNNGSYPEAVANDICITGYFGKYSDMYAMTLGVVYDAVPDVMTTKYVDGIKFVYPYPDIVLLWKQTETEVDV